MAEAPRGKVFSTRGRRVQAGPAQAREDPRLAAGEPQVVPGRAARVPRHRDHAGRRGARRRARRTRTTSSTCSPAAPRPQVGDDEFEVEPGDALYVPKNTLHNFTIHGGEVFRIAVVFAPARGFLDRLRLKHATGPPGHSTTLTPRGASRRSARRPLFTPSARRSPRPPGSGLTAPPAAAACSVVDEQRPQMPLEQVARHVAGDRVPAGDEQVRVALAHLGGHLVPHVHELAHLRGRSPGRTGRGGWRRRTRPHPSPAPSSGAGRLPGSMSMTAA